jgi:hypothetical protein
MSALCAACKRPRCMRAKVHELRRAAGIPKSPLRKSGLRIVQYVAIDKWTMSSEYKKHNIDFGFFKTRMLLLYTTSYGTSHEHDDTCVVRQ